MSCIAYFFVSFYSGAHGLVVHSYGRLIPNEFPIVNLQQISGSNGTRKITCTFSSGKTYFYANGGDIEAGGVSQNKGGVTATLGLNLVNINGFQDRGIFCTNTAATPTHYFFYRFLSGHSKFTLYIFDVNPIAEYIFSCIHVYPPGHDRCMHAPSQ